MVHRLVKYKLKTVFEFSMQDCCLSKSLLEWSVDQTLVPVIGGENVLIENGGVQ